VRVNDEVTVKEGSREHPHIKTALEAARRKGTISWVEVDPAKLSGKVMGEPKREEITLPIQEQLIVELYSR
jgi:small subunit ribosomal protein S4